MTHADPSHAVIYKIFTKDDWDTLERSGRSEGSAHDQSDGFLHFSTAQQLSETLRLHYSGAGSVVLARVPVTGLQAGTLKWEASRNGDLFPHLYASLNRSQIDQHWPLSPDEAGAYALPRSL